MALLKAGIYPLPDGKQLTIGPDFTEDDQVNLYDMLSQNYPDRYQPYKKEIDKNWLGLGEPGVGRLGELAVGPIRGFGTAALAGLEGLSNLIDLDNDSAISTGLRSAKQNFRDIDLLKPKEGYEDDYATMVSEGVGNLGAFAAVGTAAALASPALALPAALVFAGGTGVSQQADNLARTRASGKEVSAGQEIGSEIGSFVIGTSELLAIRHLAKLMRFTKAGDVKKAMSTFQENISRIDPKTGKPLQDVKDYLIGGGALAVGEAAQEAGAGMLQNLLSSAAYDADIPIFESAVDDATVGGGVGFLADAFMRTLAGRRYRQAYGMAYSEDQAIEHDEAQKLRDEEVIKLAEEAARQGNAIIDPESVPNLAEQDGEYLLKSDNYSKLDADGNVIPTRLADLNLNEIYDLQLSLEQEIEVGEQLILNKVLTEDQLNNKKIDLEKINNIIKGSNNELVNNRTPEIPLVENFTFLPNIDGTINVIGEETKENRGTFNNIEEASQAALDFTKQDRSKAIVNTSLEVADANGLLGNGTAERIGHFLYDPLFNEIDAKAIANFDSRISEKRIEQIDLKDDIAAKSILENSENSRLAEQMMQNMNTEGATPTKLSEIKEQLIKRLERTNVYPLKTNKVDHKSQLGILWKNAKEKKLKQKSYYTIEETKKLLNKSDFNDLMTELARVRFKLNRRTGERVPVKRVKNKIHASPKIIREAFESKNIKVNDNNFTDTFFTDSNFGYFAKALTGATSIKEMSDGQRQIFLAKIKSLPRFNTLTELPNYKPREFYTNQDLNLFLQINAGKNITQKNIKDFLVKQQLKRFISDKHLIGDIRIAKDGSRFKAVLKNNIINEFKEDLINSGRAKKEKGKFKLVDDYKSIRDAKAQSYINETPLEFKQRLKNTTSFNDADIERIANNDTVSRQRILGVESNNSKDILKLPPPDINQKYDFFLKTLKDRLKTYGLNDVGLKLDNALKASLNIRKKGGKVFYEPVVDKDKTEPTKGVYDSPLEAIVLATQRIDPTDQMSQAEFEAALTGTMDHEVIHALVQMGLLKESEFRILLNEAKKKLPASKIENMKKVYANETSARLNEEFVAEYFSFYRSNPEIFSPKAKNIVQKIINILRSLGQSIYDSAFDSPRTVLNDIIEGKIGSRDRGKVRNLQNYKDALEKKYGAPYEEFIGLGIKPPSAVLSDTDKDGDALSSRSTLPEDRPSFSQDYEYNRIEENVIKDVENKYKDKSFLERELIEDVQLLSAVKEYRKNLFNGINNKSIEEVLDFINLNSPLPVQREFAQQFKEVIQAYQLLGSIFKINLIPYDITNGEFKSMMDEGLFSRSWMSFSDISSNRSSALAYFDMGNPPPYGKSLNTDNDIIIFYHRSPESTLEYPVAQNWRKTPFSEKEIMSKHLDGLSFTTVLHEIVHAATARGVKFNTYNKKLMKMKSGSITTMDFMTADFKVGKAIEEKVYAAMHSYQATKQLDKLRKKVNLHIKKDMVEPFFIKTSGKMSDAQAWISNALTKKGLPETLRFYPTKNIDEFLAHSFSDQKFMTYLETIPYTPKGYKSIWDKEIEGIRRLLGLKPKNDSALSFVLSEGNRLLKLNKREIDFILTGPTGKRTRLDFTDRPRERLMKDMKDEFKEEGLEFIDKPSFSRGSGPINPTNKNRDRIYALTQVLNGKKGQLRDRGISARTRNRLDNEIYDLQQEIEQLENLDAPSYNKAGLTAKQLLYAGDIEDAVYKLWYEENGNPTAEDFQKLFKEIAPQSKRKHKWKDYKQLRKQVRDAYKKGYNDRWYEDWGINVPNIIGNANILEFSGVFGITSAQATPEVNLRDTLRTMIIARQIDPVEESKKFIAALKKANIGKRAPARLNSIQRFYKLGVFEREGSGQKTTTYALETLMALQGKFTPFMVIDRHMLKQYGMDAKSTSATENEYRMMQAINSLLATEDYVINGLPTTFTPSQVQALLWADQRFEGETASKISNEGSYESAERASQREIEELKAMEKKGTFTKEESFAGYFISPPRFSSGRKSGDIFDTNLSDDMYQSIVETAPQLVFELKMGVERGYLPERLSSAIPFEIWNEYQQKVIQSISSHGKIKFLRDLGIAHEITTSGGTWEGNVNPNIILQLPGVDPQIQKALAAIFTDAFMQDASVLQRPIHKGKRKTALLITKSGNNRFSVQELNEMLERLSQINRDGQPLNFTVLPTNRTGIMLIDPKSFGGKYTRQDANNFINLVNPVLQATGMRLEKYGQDSELFQYGADTDYSTGTRGAIQRLGNRIGFIKSSDLQRTALRDFYIPAYEGYKKFSKRIGLEPNNTPPYLQENSAFGGVIDANMEELAQADQRRIKHIKETHKGMIPKWGKDASPQALRTAIRAEKGIFPKLPPDAPSYSRSDSKVPDKYKDLVDSIGKPIVPDKSAGETLLDVTDFIPDIDTWFNQALFHAVNDLQLMNKGLDLAGKLSPEVRELEMRAKTSAMFAFLQAKAAQSFFVQVLKKGIPALVGPDGKQVLGDVRLFGGTKVIDFKHGGLAEILMPLFENPQIDLESLFKAYSIGLKSYRLDKEGKEVNITPQEVQQAINIGSDYPVVKQVYEQYQEFDAALIDYGVQMGILSDVITETQLRKNILEETTIEESEIKNYTFDQLLNIANKLNVDTKSTAEIWKENADYYPFYRKMSNDQLGGPPVASGIMSGNPLQIKLGGSKQAIEPAPLEVISRNVLSIMTAAMKNQGLLRLVSHYEKAGLAQKILMKDAKGLDIVTLFDQGEKVYYKVSDPILIQGLQSIGIYNPNGLMRFLGTPASFLREMITRSPVFMGRNMFRDSISAWATSGSDITPLLDTMKGFVSDLSELERFGIIGGYDASNDRKDVLKLIDRELKAKGMGDDGTLDPIKAIKYVWDALGAWTTASDGATRKAVYDDTLNDTGDQLDAAWQAMEIINFNRRGASPLVKVITTGIPFLNARFQGLDVIRRTMAGEYSSKLPTMTHLQKNEIQNKIRLKFAMRALFMSMTTGLYYMLMHDTDEYKEERQQVRDDNYLIPTPDGFPTAKLPIPFEYGILFKVIPERALDLAFGDTDTRDIERTAFRSLVQTFKVDPLGFQVTKPLIEVINNKSTFTGNAIVPSWMEDGLEKELQVLPQTTELARGIGMAINMSPIKIDYILKGYGGTIGTYIFTITDSAVRQVTGREYISPRIDQMPLIGDIFTSEVGGGLQEQFYQLREASNKFTASVNRLERDGKEKQLQAYLVNNSGLDITRRDVLKLDRYMTKYRKDKQEIMQSDFLDSQQKKKMLLELDRDRNIRLAYVPELKKMADVKGYIGNLLRN